MSLRLPLHTVPHAPVRNAWREIWRLAWPQTLMMFAHFSVGFADVWTAGRIGSQTQAALGLITQSLFVLLIVAIGLANGVVSSVSQSLGARRPLRAKRYAMYALALAGLTGLGLLCAGLPLRGGFLEALQTPEAVRPEAMDLLIIYLCALPAYHMLVVSNAIFRAYGEVLTPLWTMTLLALANLVLDLVLGLGWGLGWLGLEGMGAQGLGLATLGSVCIGAMLNCFMLRRKGRLSWRAFPPLRWQRKARGYLAKVSWPAGATQVVWQAGNLALFAVIGALGAEATAAMAGYGAGQRLEALLFLPAFAFNMTASVMVGRHLGEGDPAGAKRVALQVLGVGCGVITLAGLCMWQAADEVAALVSTDAAVQAQIVEYLFWNILAIGFTTASMILAGVMTGAGATLYTLYVFLIATWAVRLPLAYILAHVVGWGAEGVWISMLASQIVQSSLLFGLLLRGNWSRFAMRPSRKS